eukprot:UN10844
MMVYHIVCCLLSDLLTDFERCENKKCTLNKEKRCICSKYVCII